MELLYLFFPIISTTITSLVLSLLIPFRYILRCITAPHPSDGSVTLYEGKVVHDRRHPVHHSFTYSIRYALVDLDSASNPPPNHLSADEARRAANTNGPVLLLTVPRSVGYDQSPVTLYYCYDIEESTKTLTKCISEVTNTPWGERVTYVFDPKSDVIAKSLHVSPFMDMQGDWTMKTKEPGENLHVVVGVQHPKHGNFFTATLTAKRVEFLHGDYSAFFWLMPHKIAFWIYWQALKVWWKNVTFNPHPKFSNPSYREDAILREDKKLSCPIPSIGRNAAKRSFQVKEKSAMLKSSTGLSSNIRCFTWRDAKWPWC